jgi:hypothetical protein
MEMPKKLTISDLLKMPVGAKIQARGAGLEFAIKTTKKHWVLPDGQRIQQFLLTDATGDILADVKSQKNTYGFDDFAGRMKIAVIVGEIQATTKNVLTDVQPTKLFVGEYATYPANNEPDYGIDHDYAAFSEKEIKGKIRHGLCCAFIQSGKPVNKPLVLELTEFIVSGEIK